MLKNLLASNCVHILDSSIIVFVVERLESRPHRVPRIGAKTQDDSGGSEFNAQIRSIRLEAFATGFARSHLSGKDVPQSAGRTR